MIENDTWQPIGDLARKLAERLKAEHRRVFERDCRDYGVYLEQQKSGRVENEPMVG